MKTVLISHPLYKPGMDAIEGKAELIIPNDGDSDRILEQLKKADGFILRIGKIDRKAMEACPKLAVITRPGVGVDNVDVAAATERGIPVVICPAANSRSVAEHTVALIFALAKNLVESDMETRKGNFGIRNKYAATELFGKTVSVIGFGNIGKTVAQLCAAIGMKIVAYDPFVKRETAEAMGYGYSESLSEAVAAGDFVSLHMPSLPETKKMMNAALLGTMKRTAYLVNCARGDIVDEAALFDALSTGKIAGAAVDVLAEEPMKADHPLMALKNFIVSPHMAAQTQEATGAVVKIAVEGTLAVLAGEKWPHVCNPEVYSHPKWKDR
jgi:D-3-phosphoglycerate dehydrogenase